MHVILTNLACRAVRCALVINGRYRVALLDIFDDEKFRINVGLRRFPGLFDISNFQ